MTSYKIKMTPVQRVEEMIFLIRGQRVMLDFDLARIYGATTKRLKEQFRRNAKRFPGDFAFQLTTQEFANLRSQNATSSLHGGKRYLPTAFTEHGALMLATVLNSRTAVDASVRVVRAFVWMREQLAAHKELSQKLNELENRVSGHDEALENLFEAIRQLVEPPLPENRRQIGFLHETAPAYRVKTRKRF
ncbi:MAG: ORF6N domain-containing protein [Limisphaerales bacterium]